MKTIFSKLPKSIFMVFVYLLISVINLLVVVFEKFLKYPLGVIPVILLAFVIYLFSVIGKDSVRMYEMSKERYEMSKRICRLMDDSVMVNDTVYVLKTDTVYVTRFKYVYLDSL